MQSKEEPRIARDGVTVFLTFEEEIDLAAAWRERRDSASADRLVRAHMPLIKSIAARHPSLAITPSLRDDLEQAAAMALIEKIDHWRPEMGLRLNTYARHAMEYAVNDAARSEYGPTRIGTNLTDKRIGIQWRRSGKATDPDGLLRCIEVAGRSLGLPENRVRVTVERLSARNFSIDAVMKLNGDAINKQRAAGAAYWKLLVDAYEARSRQENGEIEERMDRERVLPYLSQAIASLPDRERAVIVLRYLVGDGTSLSGVGATLGFTKKYIHEIEQRALRRLREAMERIRTTHTARNRARCAAHLRPDLPTSVPLRIRVPVRAIHRGSSPHAASAAVC